MTHKVWYIIILQPTNQPKEDGWTDMDSAGGSWSDRIPQTCYHWSSMLYKETTKILLMPALDET